jgi:DNA-binding response OmpR family regulator
MSKGRILVIEDDFDIANMLRIYFAGMMYETHIAHRGSEGLTLAHRQLPDLIILDIVLPDMDGYAVCRELRTATRTSHVPIIFLTQKDERSYRIAGLELGADDYITKPFDIEELRLRVQNTIVRSQRENLTDPRSGLPAGRLIEERLRHILRKDGWALVDCHINHFEAFREVSGFVAADDVLHFTALLIGEVLDALGTGDDFIGHAATDSFIVITAAEAAPAIGRELKRRFAQEILVHYGYADRERGGLLVQAADGTQKQVPLMALAVGIVTASDRKFADIRQITEAAAEARRQDID